MKRTFLSLALILIAISVRANQKDTICVSNFNAKPYSYENSVLQIQAAIEECRRTGAKVLSFPKGRYDIWPEGATRAEYHISNTSTQEECPSKIKTIGLLFKGMEGLTIEGNGSTLMFHGKMVMILFDRCKNMTLQNLSTDFERPTATEITYTRVGKGETEVSLHADSRYEIVNGRMMLYGEGWKSNKNHCIELDSQTGTSTYSKGWDILSKSNAKEISKGIVSFATPDDFTAKQGNILTIRDIIRDQVGMHILESSNITFRKVNIHYMHGLGIVSQYVDTVTMDRVNCVPKTESGRILASSADMMHFSGCKGKITVSDCRFSGAHDDPINIHGTNLRIVKKLDNNRVVLRFMHGQSYGFNAFFVGDEIAFVRAKTMERQARSKVASVKRMSEKEIELSFIDALPDNMEIGFDCVENMTWTPQVEVRNSHFGRTPARGILVTTPRKVVIENNIFTKTGMSAVLIESDTQFWFESGPVCDVLIKNNTFIDCAYQGGPGNAVIGINPSNSEVDTQRPVHKNIRIEGNTFKTFDYPILYAKSTAGILFKDNKIINTHTMQPSSDNKYNFYLNGCSDVIIEGTLFGDDMPGRNIMLENMKRGNVKHSKDITTVK